MIRGREKAGGERNNGKYGLKVLGVLVLRQLILDSAVGGGVCERRICVEMGKMGKKDS